MIGVKWSQSQRAWYVQDNANYRTKFGLQPKPLLGKAALLQIHPINQAEMKKYIETLQLKGYSPNTINTYRNEFAQLLHIIKDKNIISLDANRLRNYFLYCTNELKLSENTLHSRINAIKFYFEKVLARDKLFVEIPRPKKKIILPNVLAKQQVERLFSNLESLKHRSMLYLTYSAGLRVSEVVNLRIKDIHSERMVITIKGAKGKKIGQFPYRKVYYYSYESITIIIIQKNGYLKGNTRIAHTVQEAYSRFSKGQRMDQKSYKM